MRVAKKGDDAGGKGAAVGHARVHARPTWRSVEAQPLSRWLPVSGAVQPVRQATVKAKVSGDVRQITVREGETVQAGQVLARIDTADLEAKLIERIGALESAKAQLALAEKTRATNQALLKQNFISQNAFDNSESSYNVVAGHRQVGRGAGAARAERAARRGRHRRRSTGIVAKRHVQPGEKVAFDSPLVTVVDLTDMELQAAVPAVDVPELAIGKTVELTIDGFGERRFTGPHRADQSGDRAGHARDPRLRRHPERRRRAARRDVRHRPHRARRERAGADAAGDGRAHRGRADVRLDRRGRQARQAQRRRPAAATTPPAASRSRPRCRRTRRCSPRASTT